jgi:hypothetical protein
LAGEVERYVEAARRVGHGDPADVDEYLRRGGRAFLAGERATARAVFDALLPPIADGEIHLGQHEMVDEVLQVSLGDCAARYVASVYLTTAPKDRARAVHQAIDAVQGLAPIWTPVGQMERVATGPLPETRRDPFDTAIGEDGDVERPTLSTPSVGDLIATAGSGAGIDAKSRDAMLQAMRRATTKRVEGIVGNKRRDHYWHAATLLACCLEAARAIGDEREVREWVDAVRQGYSRHYAFQEEYRRALASMAS